MTGKQTIKGDANLTAENIKSGVSIFNVAGTFEGYGTFDLAKVTEYTPAIPALSAISKIVVSGFDSTNAYSEANGTYYVTTETERESNVFKRIYQHVSGQRKILFDGESADCECGNWLLTSVNDGDYILSFGFTEGKEDISSDEYYFDNWVDGYGEYATLEVTKTNYPATDMVLKGVLATGYTDGEWSFASTEQSFTGFEVTPKAGFIYAAAGDRLVGSSIGCPYPMLLMPLNGNLSATSYGVNITPTVNGTLTFDSHGAKFTGDQYIDLPIDVGFFAKNATICFKIYQTGSGRYGYVAGTEDCYLGIDSNGGVFSLWAGQGDGWDIFDSDGSGGRSDVEIPRNTEVHVAYIHNNDASKYQLYIDGVLEKEISDSRSINGGVNLRFGAWGNGSYRFVGSMRDIRVYDKALSAEEIAAIANS